VRAILCNFNPYTPVHTRRARETCTGLRCGKARAIQRYLRPFLRAVHVLGVLLVLHFAANILGALGEVQLLATEDAAMPLSPRSARSLRTKAAEHPSKQRLDDVVAELEGHNPFCPGCSEATADSVRSSTTGVAAAPGDPRDPKMWITWADGTVLGRRLAPGEPESELPLSLLATMQAEPRDLSMATIAHEDAGGIGLYGVGEDVIPGVTVHRVAGGVVHLRNGGTLEYLALEDRHTPPKPPSKALKKKKPKKKKPKKGKHEIAGARDAISCDGSQSCTIDRAFVNKLIANPAQLARQVRFRPLRKDD
jgi:hypothetical protein